MKNPADAADSEVVDAEVWCSDRSLCPLVGIAGVHYDNTPGCAYSTQAANERLSAAVREVYQRTMGTLDREWLLAQALLNPVYDWIAYEFPDRHWTDRPEWLDTDLLAAALARRDNEPGMTLDDWRQIIRDEQGWAE